MRTIWFRISEHYLSFKCFDKWAILAKMEFDLSKYLLEHILCTDFCGYKQNNLIHNSGKNESENIHIDRLKKL